MGQAKNGKNSNSGTVTCSVKFDSEQISQCFENALRKLNFVLRSTKRPTNPRVQIDRIGKLVPISSLSAINLSGVEKGDFQGENDKSSINAVDIQDLPDLENNLELQDAKSEDISKNDSKEISISSEEESHIWMDLFNTFSNPHSRHISKAVQLYLTGNNNGIGPNLARDVQNLINTRHKDIEKYVEILRKTNMFKNTK